MLRARLEQDDRVEARAVAALFDAVASLLSRGGQRH